MKKIIYLRYLTVLLALLCAAVSFGRQTGVEKAGPYTRAAIFPTLVTLQPGAEQEFNIVIEATRLKAPFNPEDITWSVNGVPGGNAKTGTISAKGVYKAPAAVSVSPEVYISGKTKAADNAVSTATVLLNGGHVAYKTVLSFAEPVNALKNFKEPVSIAVEKNGNFLIADDKVLRFSPAGKFISSFGEKQGDIIGHLDGLLNVAVDNTGKIFASDQKITPPRILAFTPQGKHLYSFSMKGYHPGMTFNTRGIAFDSRNRMYIGDIDLQRVTVFDNAGNYQFHFGTAGGRTIDFNGYYDLALDQNNDVFVANYFGKCQKLDAKGNYLFTFATPDPPAGIVYTTDVATDSRGNVYVVVHGAKKKDGKFSFAKDKEGNRVNIVKYNNNGDFISNIRLSDAERVPVSLVIDQQDRLVVLFSGDKETGVEVLKAVN